MKNNYDLVLAKMPKWKPTKKIPKFGVDAIKKITGCELKEAVEIRERLEYESAFPQHLNQS